MWWLTLLLVLVVPASGDPVVTHGKKEDGRIESALQKGIKDAEEAHQFFEPIQKAVRALLEKDMVGEVEAKRWIAKLDEAGEKNFAAIVSLVGEVQKIPNEIAEPALQVLRRRAELAAAQKANADDVKEIEAQLKEREKVLSDALAGRKLTPSEWEGIRLRDVIATESVTIDLYKDSLREKAGIPGQKAIPDFFPK